MAHSADQISEAIYQIEQRLKARGMPDLPEETVKALVGVINEHGLDSIGTNYDQIAEQVQHAMQQSVEGGFVNDQSGQASAQMRQQYGLPAPGQVTQPQGQIPMAPAMPQRRF